MESLESAEIPLFMLSGEMLTISPFYSYMTVDSWQEKTGLNFNFPASCNTGTVDPHYWNFTHNVPPAIIMPN